MLYINRKLSTSWFKICLPFLVMTFHSGDIPVFRLKIQRGDPYQLRVKFFLLRFIYHIKACFKLVLKMYEFLDSDQNWPSCGLSKWPIYQNLAFSLARFIIKYFLRFVLPKILISRINICFQSLLTRKVVLQLLIQYSINNSFS